MKKSLPEINPTFVMLAKADGTAFWVPSRTSDRCWLVERIDGNLVCRCPARISNCCHMRAVEAYLKVQWMKENAITEYTCKCGAKYLLQGSSRRNDNGLCLQCELALDEQQAEVERLANLPRTLANVTESQEQKAEQAQAEAVANTQKMVAYYMSIDDTAGKPSWPDVPEEVTPAEPQKDWLFGFLEDAGVAEVIYAEDAGVVTIDKRAQQAARSAKREAALLYTDNRPFSIWKD